MSSSYIRTVREDLLEKQGNLCPLCGTFILKEEAALDHCHRTGMVRMVLHRWCNALLGRIENWSRRQGKINNVDFLENVVQYLKSEQTDIVHPKHALKLKRKENGKGKRKPKPKRKVSRRKDRLPRRDAK